MSDVLAPGGWSARIATRKYGADFRVFGVSASGEFEGPAHPLTQLDQVPGFADSAPEGVHLWTLSGINFERMTLDKNGDATFSLGGAILSHNGLADQALIAAIDEYLA